MFSNLGPLFKTVFRQAEETDTRQAIRREEKEQGRRNKDEDEDNRISANLWEDSASVSVDSLRAFLIDFLKTKSLKEKIPFKEKGKQQDPSLKAQAKEPKNTFVAKATNAYQNMADKTSPVSQNLSDTNAIEKPDDADLVESEEIRKIYELIEDLETLSQNGVNSLYIQQAESFVDSLRQAVLIEKSKI